MSKYRISKKHSNFSIIPNKLAQALNYNLEALGLYVYIFSLPPDWEFYKTHLMKVCNIGIRKLNKLLDILEGHELVQIVQIRNSNGQFSHFDLQVKEGDHFKINNLEKVVQPEGQNGRAVKTVRPLCTTTKIISTNINSNNKDNIFCSSIDEPKSYFDDFWKLYPRKQKKKRSQDIWTKQKLDSVGQIIIDSLIERLKTEWLDKEKQFIPLPDSFLNGRRWEDEIIVDQNFKKNGRNHKNNEQNTEIKSTVGWYYPDPMYN